MKKSNIGAIIRKEFNRFFTDRRLVMTAIILPGLMIYLLYSFMGSAMSNMYSVEDDFAPTVYAVNAPASIAALAQEVGLSGIRVNCIAPGVITTEMNAALSGETLEALKEETPLYRLGTPEDIAAAAVFLAGEDAAFITGQVLGVNGGMVI